MGQQSGGWGGQDHHIALLHTGHMCWSDTLGWGVLEPPPENFFPVPCTLSSCGLSWPPLGELGKGGRWGRASIRKNGPCTQGTGTADSTTERVAPAVPRGGEEESAWGLEGRRGSSARSAPPMPEP